VGETTHVGMLRKSGIGCSSDKQSNEQQKMFAAHDFALSFCVPDARELVIRRKMAMRVLLRMASLCGDGGNRPVTAMGETFHQRFMGCTCSHMHC
jgi:hypothetical protein